MATHCDNATKLPLLVGKTVLTSDQLFHVKQHDHEKKYLWFTRLCPDTKLVEDMTRHWTKAKTLVTGIFLLQCVVMTLHSNSSVQNIGFLYFTCDVDARNKLIMESQILNQGIKNGVCKIAWFSDQLKIQLASQHVTWKIIANESVNCFRPNSAPKHTNENPPMIKDSFVINWKFMRHVQKWFDTIKLMLKDPWTNFYSGVPTAKDKRRLTCIEKLWLYVVMYLDLDGKIVSCNTFKCDVASVEVSKDVYDGYLGTPMQFDMAEMHAMNSVTYKNNSYKIVCELLNRFKQRQQISDTYNEIVIKPFKKARKQFANVPLFIAFKISRLMKDIKKEFPCDIYSEQLMNRWISKTKAKIAATLNPDDIYEEVCKNISLRKNRRTFATIWRCWVH